MVYLQEAIALIESWSTIGALEAYLALAWIRQVQGDTEAANAAIQQAQRITVRFDATDYDDQVTALIQARLWMMQGNFTAVQRWAEGQELYPFTGLDLPPETDRLPEKRLRKYELVIVAQLLLAQNCPDAALAALEVLCPLPSGSSARH